MEAAQWTKALMDLRNSELGVTVNVGTITGGIADNIVPDHAELTFEARFKRDEDYKKIYELVQNMINNPFVSGVHTTIANERYSKPIEPNNKTISLIKKWQDIANEIGRPFALRHRYGLSDGNHISDCDCAIIDSMGPAGDGGHGIHERMLISSVESTFEICKVLIDVVEENAQLHSWSKSSNIHRLCKR